MASGDEQDPGVAQTPAAIPGSEVVVPFDPTELSGAEIDEELATSTPSAVELAAMLELEHAHPKYEGGRVKVVAALAARLRELEAEGGAAEVEGPEPEPHAAPVDLGARAPIAARVAGDACIVRIGARLVPAEFVREDVGLRVRLLEGVPTEVLVERADVLPA